jgi:hypothetical protein
MYAAKTSFDIMCCALSYHYTHPAVRRAVFRVSFTHKASIPSRKPVPIITPTKLPYPHTSGNVDLVAGTERQTRS